MYTDLLIRIKNAQLAGQKTTEAKFSKINKAIAEILTANGYLTKTDVKGKPPKLSLELSLNSQKPMEGLRFLSRPSVRRYAKAEEIKRVKSGKGILVISTSRGVMTGDEAKKARLGGQLLFEIW